MKNNLRCFFWKAAYLAAVLVYPFLYQSIASKIMATYDFSLAPIIVAFLCVIGFAQSLSQRYAVFCGKKWLVPINGVILAVLLTVNLVGWFRYSWFSTTVLLCAGISIMDFLLALFQKPARFFLPKRARRYRIRKPVSPASAVPQEMAEESQETERNPLERSL